jgi:hypothetical protein
VRYATRPPSAPPRRAADARAVADLVVVQAERDQLPGCDDTVLPIGQFRDHTIERTMRLSFRGIVPGFLSRIERHRG